jgi:hypothetical protein
MTERKKPQGRTGAIKLSDAGPEWGVIDFPSEKRRRELMIAEMFVRGANQLIMHESPEQPRYPPFSGLVQNDENDLDFTITTSLGVKLMDLAEFAPLDRHGPQFKDAPRQLDQATKSDLLLEIVRRKSAHQGGLNRLLLIYATEYGFKVDLITIEIMRKGLNREPPQFDRVYYISVHNTVDGSVWEIFPGTPHHTLGEWSEQDLRRLRTHFPHPDDLIEKWEVTGTMHVPFYGECSVIIRYSIPFSLKPTNVRG